MYRLKLVCTTLGILGLAQQLQAGQLGAVLKPQIELQAACIVNNQLYLQGATAIDFGSLDFGEQRASASGVIETSLSNAQHNAIQIQCSDNAEVNITFGAGLNDGHVPSAANNNYFHALSNGQDFVAYNLLDAEDKSIIHPQQRISRSAATALVINLYAQAFLTGLPISTGHYQDTIAITIEF